MQQELPDTWNRRMLPNVQCDGVLLMLHSKELPEGMWEWTCWLCSSVQICIVSRCFQPC